MDQPYFQEKDQDVCSPFQSQCTQPVIANAQNPKINQVAKNKMKISLKLPKKQPSKADASDQHNEQSPCKRAQSEVKLLHNNTEVQRKAMRKSNQTQKQIKVQSVAVPNLKCNEYFYSLQQKQSICQGYLQQRLLQNQTKERCLSRKSVLRAIVAETAMDRLKLKRCPSLSLKYYSKCSQSIKQKKSNSQKRTTNLLTYQLNLCNFGSKFYELKQENVDQINCANPMKQAPRRSALRL